MTLTEEQQKSLWDKNGQPVRGLHLLSARPGTGKTTTLTEYCIDVASRWQGEYRPWQGMAIVSYTNVAKDEFESKIRDMGSANMLLRHPNFVGTLDAFVNQYLFLPYGARIMRYSAGRPQLVGEPYFQWVPPPHLFRERSSNAFSPQSFDCYSLGTDGIPFRIDKERRQRRRGVNVPPQPVTDRNAEKILTMKKHVWRHGMALQSDANYIALEVLRASPILARALIGRFPVLVVDEAQDMTAIQHALIDHLVISGLGHVVLVGDENQAIYEWNTARPQLFVEKKLSKKWDSEKTLVGTFRCSPAISAALTSMAHDGIVVKPPINARNAKYTAPVNIASYEPGQQIEALKIAVTSIAHALTNKPPHDSNPTRSKSIAILARSAEHVRELQAGFTGIRIHGSAPPVWKDRVTLDYLKVVHRLRCRDVYGAVGAYEALLEHAGKHDSITEMRAAIKAQHGLLSADMVGYRLALSRDLEMINDNLPAEGALRISECGKFLSGELTLLNRGQAMSIKYDCDSFADSGKEGQDRMISSLFTARHERTWICHPSFSDIRLVFSTVHGVKGETYDAVLFCTKKGTLHCGCPRSAVRWDKILDHRIIECETKRIAYVALSRAAQILTVLAPVDVADCWRTHANQDDKQRVIQRSVQEVRQTLLFLLLLTS